MSLLQKILLIAIIELCAGNVEGSASEENTPTKQIEIFENFANTSWKNSSFPEISGKTVEQWLVDTFNTIDWLSAMEGENKIRL